MHRPLFSRVLRFPTGAPFPRCNGLVMQLPGFQEKAFCSGITSLAVTSPSMQALTSSWLAAQLETVGVPPGAELALAVSGELRATSSIEQEGFEGSQNWSGKLTNGRCRGVALFVHLRPSCSWAICQGSSDWCSWHSKQHDAE